jgi:hypothetical protein
LSTGLVVLVALAIGLGLVFLLVLLGLLFTLRGRKDERQPRPNSIYADQPEKKHRPTSFLATLNAATAMITADQSRTSRFHPDDSISTSDTHGLANAAVPVGGATSPEPDYDDYVRTRW